jgi:hypothetical protein
MLGEYAIFAYTRQQAIDNGVLIDVTEAAREAGFKYPVAVTSALWQAYIEPAEDLQRQGQSTEGRLWDLLFMLHHSARHTHTNIIIYTCLFQMAPADPAIPKKIKAHIGPGDTPSPVLTIMLPEED